MNELLEDTNINTSKEKTTAEKDFVIAYLNRVKNPFMMLTAPQVAKDLHIGINQAYELFDQEGFPSIQIGKRKKVSLVSYLFWKLNQNTKGGD